MNLHFHVRYATKNKENNLYFLLYVLRGFEGIFSSLRYRDLVYQQIVNRL